ncbi:MoxR-like ATPase [Clostridium saccharoperbutylacetonicum]|uniref:MoxR-like ATPase n=1 Tax=Clostridium saccharoperbutylacetonicum N1-4(HMT) TaxID=931276 RepID=M1M212_9CLOT|nr:AAA family ATPase [Clostridium saccharoperbutylacetonicum]AGF59655.1 MoxR-like ATPase [Clostridium saccharoperbutylacetonicum N1-4(HMT)]NRT64595.1 MoxR-like ATPase [Clostridium saccharoperbutylacetonicum]NSB28963.1 MoxR-like ATPase [Clostridium saccharoperbutylacetonicum]NSB46177.1 MoxR-like ATPase [Clostridium saccharoperbutylacetonicum]
MFDFSKVDEEAKVDVLDINKRKKKVEKFNPKGEVSKRVNTSIVKAVEGTINDILKIEEELNELFIERENEIRMLTLAFITGSNGFFHGPAGTGKSALVEEYRNRIEDCSYFRILMGKTTEPSEIFGPVSINAMKNDIYKVNTKNKLPEANISFVDEIFKANSAVLNNLLTIMNEKLFFNEEIQKVPLISLIGASNEYYEEDNLIALYDRFLLRWNIDYINEPSNRITLFKNYLDRRRESSLLQENETVKMPVCKINIKDLMVINEKVKEITISIKVLNTYNKLLNTLLRKNIVISDRRKNESLKIVQAAALLDGRDEAEIQDLEVLKYTLWTYEEDLAAILEEVEKLANPNKNKLRNLKATFEAYKKQLLDLEDNKGSDQYVFNKTMAVTEIIKNINYGVNTINGILSSMKKEGRDNSKEFNDFMKLLNDMEEYAENIKKDIVL